MYRTAVLFFLVRVDQQPHVNISSDLQLTGIGRSIAFDGCILIIRVGYMSANHVNCTKLMD